MVIRNISVKNIFSFVREIETRSAPLQPFDKLAAIPQILGKETDLLARNCMIWKGYFRERELTQTAGHIILGFFDPGGNKELFSNAVFYQAALQEEGSIIGNACRLLNIVWNQHNRVFFLKFQK